MHLSKTLLLLAPIASLALTQARDAAACGGCLIQQGESTQVTGHEMVLSISKKQTTLWDQITYSGNPSSFAWVLPIKGTVDFGLSSDALFGTLEQQTKVFISSPQITCQPPPFCGNANEGGFGATSAAAGTGGGPPPVDVLVHDVVGPYEMVQLKSSDPTALQQWLASHSYAVPADIQPVIAAYVAEGFNFLALKLVPGQGVSAMRPVRVTSPGASPVLPLRMVAAGTGAITPITLWVLGEGRYETANLPTFTIDPATLVWNWDTQSSNYAAVKKASFDKSKGTAWLVEDAEPIGQYAIKGPIQNLVQYDVQNSGYGEPMGPTAQAEFDQDMSALFTGIQETALWVTRLHGELSRTALAADLELGASADQRSVNRYLQVKQSTGTAPKCPTFPPCDDGGNASDGGWDQWGNPKTSTSCAMTDSGSSPMSVFALLGAAGIVVSVARRKRR
jgi:Uncharacterized protein conserved in bacteria (DUF2330)